MTLDDSWPPAAAGLGEPLELCHTLVDAIPDLLLVVNRGGRILYLNRGALGMNRETALGAQVLEFVPPDMRAELRESLEEIFRGAEPRVRELPATAGDGLTRWFATYTAAVQVGGRVVAATILARDITDQRRAETALLESEERYRTMIEHAPEAIVVLDADSGRFVEANRNACRLFDLQREALLESNPVALSPPAQPDGRPSAEAARERINEALDGGVPSFEWVHCTSAGADLQCEVRLVRLPAGARRLVRGSITEVSRQRKLEEHLQQWQKMEAIGQLAGGIAHDFNNILLVITAAAETLTDALPTDDDLRLEAEWIREAAGRGTALTAQLMAFARRQDQVPHRVDLNRVVTDITALLGRLLGSRIRLVTRLAPGEVPVRAEASQLAQVLMNLVINARDAMPAGGTVTLSTARLATGSASAPRADVHLRVKDTGTGMDDGTRNRIFEPFFTTKPDGCGTGLGLSIVLGLVQKWGGRIEVSSRPALGTLIEVILPEAH